MPSATELKIKQDKLFRQELPQYLDKLEVSELVKIYNRGLQLLRRHRLVLERHTTETERRTAVLKARVVVLENA